jgi:MFS family permease
MLEKNYGWVIVFTGFVAMFVVYGGFVNSFGLFLIPLMETFEHSTTEVSAIISFQAVGGTIGANIVAYIIRKKGPKACMLCAAVILTITAFIFAGSSHLWQFYICGIMIGVARSGMTMIPISVLINNWFEPGKRSFPLSVASMGSGIGGLAFNPVLNIIIQRAGWRFALMMAGALVAAFYVPVVGILSRSFPKKSETKKTAQSENMPYKETREMTFSEALRNKYFIISAATYAVISGTGISLVFYIAPYYTHIGFTTDRAALVAGISVGSIALGKIMIGWIGDTFGTAKATGTGLFSIASSLLLLCLVPLSSLILIPAIFFYGLGVGSITVTMPAVTNHFFGEKNFTKFMGFLAMFAGIGGVIIPLITGVVIDFTNS